MTALRHAVFLDRDGTLNVDREYITRPEQLQLLPGVGAALRSLQAAGFACVVITNQSAVGRGMMTEADLQRVHDEMNRQLAEFGVTLDGIYACTFAPATSDPLALEHPDRKPAPGLLLRAAADLHLDLAKSWMIGDTFRDILAGQNAGCLSCAMVRTGKPIDESLFEGAKPFVIVDDLAAAARQILCGLPPRGAAEQNKPTEFSIWGDKVLFPYCPACGNIIRFILPPKGGQGLWYRCRKCGAELHFPRLGWRRMLGLAIYLAACLFIGILYCPLLPMMLGRILGIVLIGVPDRRGESAA